METKEALHKLKYMRDAYQKLIDENISEGEFVGDGVTGTWKSETSLKDVYRGHVEALNLAISALEEKERNKVHCGECKYMLGGYSGYYECSKNHWRVYKAYSCEDGEKK